MSKSKPQITELVKTSRWEEVELSWQQHTIPGFKSKMKKEKTRCPAWLAIQSNGFETLLNIADCFDGRLCFIVNQ
jgi:hypothetical protein